MAQNPKSWFWAFWLKMKEGFRGRGIIFFALGLLFCLNILAWIAVHDLTIPPVLEVNFFNIGQGDAIFINTPKGNQILIDGGKDTAILEKLAKEMPFWDKSIDLVILTHPEHDHLGGLIEVLKRYRVENILWSGVSRDTAEYKEWERLIEEEKAKISIAKFGQKITSGKTFLEIFYPFENLSGKKIEDSNNTSIVTKLVFGKSSFFFTGDIYRSIEKELLNRGVDLNSDVLKIAHHGSETSSATDFIQTLSPDIAVISVGKNNPYGHPHQEVLDTLKKFAIKVLRTDLDGDIEVSSDGENFKIKTTASNESDAM